MRDDILTVVFHFRELPFRLTFDRTGTYEGQIEYVWEVLVDVDNDKETGADGNDFALSAFHFVPQSKAGARTTQSIENATYGSGWVLSSDGARRKSVFGQRHA